MINRICFITTLFFSLSFSQDYLWPVKAKKEITAVFGEERPGRYHTGVDVRTFGETGYHLVAIDDGYIARIRTSSKGYGKTIYLQLHDGNTAVYAHLDHFTPKVDNLVNALHEEYGKYTIDHKIDPEDYPVKKGDLIGYSGDTGGVSGPTFILKLVMGTDNQLIHLNILYIWKMNFHLKQNLSLLFH